MKIKMLLHEIIVRRFDDKKLRYLFVGGINTTFGYIAGVLIFNILEQHLHLIFIGIISNVISITFSYSTYKLFVFKTKGNALAEYFKSYVVYGITFLISISLLWILIEGYELNIWVVQAVIIAITVVVSYSLHDRFTFRGTEK